MCGMRPRWLRAVPSHPRVRSTSAGAADPSEEPGPLPLALQPADGSPDRASGDPGRLAPVRFGDDPAHPILLPQNSPGLLRSGHDSATAPSAKKFRWLPAALPSLSRFRGPPSARASSTGAPCRPPIRSGPRRPRSPIRSCLVAVRRYGAARDDGGSGGRKHSAGPRPPASGPRRRPVHPPGR